MPLRFATPADLTASHDGACFGGKALGLAALAAAGVRVPPFFAVEASTALPATWSAADRAEFLRRAADVLSLGRLAVRSSALGEDGAARSFAGVFETVLGVSSAPAALDAASRCIASGAASRATTYAGASTALPVGLVCQLQVEARSAGVCFTRDPSGRDGAVVIEAIRGTGDVLVSGATDPERWRVYRTGLGGWEARREGASQEALSADEAIAAAREALDLAARFGRPLDLEWARDARGALWWLQARPITASATPPAVVIERSCPDADDGPVTVWGNWNIRETMPDPLTPLSWTIWREVFLRLMLRATMDLPARSPLYRPLAALDRVNGRVYWNMNCLAAIPGFGWLSRKALWFIDEEAYRLLTPLYDAGVIRPRKLPGPRLALLGAMLAAQAKSLVSVFESLSSKRTTQRLEAFGAAERAPLSRPVASYTDAGLGVHAAARGAEAPPDGRLPPDAPRGDGAGGAARGARHPRRGGGGLLPRAARAFGHRARRGAAGRSCDPDRHAARGARSVRARARPGQRALGRRAGRGPLSRAGRPTPPSRDAGLGRPRDGAGAAPPHPRPDALPGRGRPRRRLRRPGLDAPLPSRGGDRHGGRRDDVPRGGGRARDGGAVGVRRATCDEVDSRGRHHHRRRRARDGRARYACGPRRELTRRARTSASNGFERKPTSPNSAGICDGSNDPERTRIRICG